MCNFLCLILHLEGKSYEVRRSRALLLGIMCFTSIISLLGAILLTINLMDVEAKDIVLVSTLFSTGLIFIPIIILSYILFGKSEYSFELLLNIFAFIVLFISTMVNFTTRIGYLGGFFLSLSSSAPIAYLRLTNHSALGALPFAFWTFFFYTVIFISYFCEFFVTDYPTLARCITRYSKIIATGNICIVMLPLLFHIYGIFRDEIHTKRRKRLVSSLLETSRSFNFSQIRKTFSFLDQKKRKKRTKIERSVAEIIKNLEQYQSYIPHDVVDIFKNYNRVDMEEISKNTQFELLCESQSTNSSLTSIDSEEDEDDEDVLCDESFHTENKPEIVIKITEEEEEEEDVFDDEKENEDNENNNEYVRYNCDIIEDEDTETNELDNNYSTSVEKVRIVRLKINTEKQQIIKEEEEENEGEGEEDEEEEVFSDDDFSDDEDMKKFDEKTPLSPPQNRMENKHNSNNNNNNRVIYNSLNGEYLTILVIKIANKVSDNNNNNNNNNRKINNMNMNIISCMNEREENNEFLSISSIFDIVTELVIENCGRVEDFESSDNYRVICSFQGFQKDTVHSLRACETASLIIQEINNNNNNNNNNKFKITCFLVSKNMDKSVLHFGKKNKKFSFLGSNFNGCKVIEENEIFNDNDNAFEYDILMNERCAGVVRSFNVPVSQVDVIFRILSNGLVQKLEKVYETRVQKDVENNNNNNNVFPSGGIKKKRKRKSLKRKFNEVMFSPSTDKVMFSEIKKKKELFEKNDWSDSEERLMDILWEWIELRYFERVRMRLEEVKDLKIKYGMEKRIKFFEIFDHRDVN